MIRFAVLSLMILATLPAAAANFDDPTWPCIQRKVPNLSIGQMWAGPLIDPDAEVAEDEPLQVLAAALAVRRTSMEEAEKLIDDFAAASVEDKDVRLARLFADVFERIDSERAQLIGGIARYADRQSGLAERIGTLNEEVAALDAKDDKTNDEWDKMEELADKVEWDTRIFDERAQSLTYVCETPVILEKRAFAIARMVMQRLE